MKKLLVLLFRMLFSRKSKVNSSTIDGENVKRVLYNSRTRELITYYKNGVIQEEANLINGIFQGKAIKNYPTGKLKMELNYLNDELEGKAVYYYEDGNIEEFYYENGELRESWKSFLLRV